MRWLLFIWLGLVVLRAAAEEVDPPTADPAGVVAAMARMPAAADVGIEILNDREVRLLPFGRIAVPPGPMVWRVASRQPPVFVAHTAASDSEAVVLAVMPALPSPTARKAMIKGHSNTLVQQLTAAGMRRVRADRRDDQAEVATVARYSLTAELPDGGERHVVNELHFGDDFTYIFQATAGTKERGDTLMEVVQTFSPEKTSPRQPVPAEVESQTTN